MTNLDSGSAQIPYRNPHGDGRYIPILDGWRAVAILLVLLFHGVIYSEMNGHPYLQALGQVAGRTGALGVLVFFAISGYLITGRLLMESGQEGRISARSFYVKRAFRIVPPLAVYLLTVAILDRAGVIELVPRDWSAVFFLTNYLRGSWYTAHFWSLSVEEHFYLFWPLCILVAGWRRAMWVGIAIVVAVGTWRPWVLAHTVNRVHSLQHTDLRVDYILIGAVLALSFEFYPATKRCAARLGNGWGLLFLTLLLLLTARSERIDLRSLEAVIIGLLVCASAVADAKWPRKILANRPMLFFGKISYSLYIWQELFLGPSHSAMWRSPYALPVKFTAAVAAACVSYSFVEKPFIKLGRNLLSARPEPVIPYEAAGDGAGK